MSAASSAPIAPPAAIAFMGLGKMGLPMALRLVGAGYAVRGYDLAQGQAAAIARAGGTASASPAEAVTGCLVLITMLPHGKAVQSALFGGDTPLISLLPRGALVLEMSSSSPIDTRDLASKLSEHGVSVVDAPVSGGVKRATEGSLAIMAGGSTAEIARVKPVLEAMGNSIFETGPIGSAHAMKALNNYVSAAGLLAACEALRVGAKFGLDPALMTDVLNVSTGRNNATEVKLKQFIVSRTYGSGFSLALMAKDLRTADDLAKHLQVAAPLSHACTALWNEADAKLGPGADHTAIDRYIGMLSGSDEE